MAAPPATVLSTGAIGPDRQPSLNTSTSITALSVSTVATTVPRVILSPGCFSQVTTTPSVMVSESCGITMLYNAPGGGCTAGARDEVLGSRGGAGSAEPEAFSCPPLGPRTSSLETSSETCSTDSTM